MCNISAFRPLICRVLSLPRTAPGSRISAGSSVSLKRRGAEFSKWIITCRAMPCCVRAAGSPSVRRARKRATWFRSSKRLSSYYREELEPRQKVRLYISLRGNKLCRARLESETPDIIALAKMLPVRRPNFTSIIEVVA